MGTSEASLRMAERLAAIQAKTSGAEAPFRRLGQPAAESATPDATFSLEGISLLQGLTVEERRMLLAKCQPCRFAAGAVMIERFTAGTSVFFLVSGVARVVHNVGADGEVTIATVGAGNTLGEIAAIDGLGRTATILAETDCLVAEMSSADFGTLLGSRADIGLELLRRWASTIRRLDEKVSFLATGSPDQRVYTELVRIAKLTTGGGDRWTIPDMPSHREIAVVAQTSRELIIRVLAELARTGVVERRGKTLHIHDYDALRRLATDVGTTPAPAPAPGQTISA
jgi:CRP/FNR family transcriptional regulator, cyclic AMP receptor protein